MGKKIKNNARDIFFKSILAIALILFINWPILFYDKELNILYLLFGFCLGWAIGKDILYYRRKKAWWEGRDSYPVNPFFSFYAIFIYIFIFVILDYNILISNFSSFAFKVLLSTLFLYDGLIDLRTKKAYFYGGKVTRKQAVFYGIISIVVSLIILFVSFLNPGGIKL